MDNDAETGRPRMKLTIVFRIDLNDSMRGEGVGGVSERGGGTGGYVPMFIYVKTVGTTGMASVQNMKRLIAELRNSENWKQNKQKVEGVCGNNNNWLTVLWNGTKKKCS